MLITPRNISLFLLSVTTFSALCVQAADVPLRGPIPFEAFDKDGNKMISPQEFVETHNLRIKMRTDANMSPGMERSFTFFDVNGDSQLSPEELNDTRGAMRKLRQSRSPGRPQGMRPGMQQGMGGGKGQAREMPSFSDFDLNSDGEVTIEEFHEARSQRIRKRAEQGYQMRNAANAPSFGAIDKNRDRKVTEDEFKAHQAAHQQMMQGR